jgi:hypothetical protein
MKSRDTYCYHCTFPNSREAPRYAGCAGINPEKHSDNNNWAVRKNGNK